MTNFSLTVGPIFTKTKLLPLDPISRTIMKVSDSKGHIMNHVFELDWLKLNIFDGGNEFH